MPTTYSMTSWNWTVHVEHGVVGDDVGVAEILQDVQLARNRSLALLAGGDRRDHHLDGHRLVRRAGGGPGRPRPCPRRRSASRSGIPGRSSGTTLAVVDAGYRRARRWRFVAGQGADGQVHRRVPAAAEAANLRGPLGRRSPRPGRRTRSPPPRSSRHRGAGPCRSGAVDLGAVGAAKVAEEADRRVELDQEVVPREEPVLGHRELDLRRPPDHERLVALEGVFSPQVRTGGDPQDSRSSRAGSGSSTWVAGLFATSRTSRRLTDPAEPRSHAVPREDGRVAEAPPRG